jgi:hypothetical protein
MGECRYSVTHSSVATLDGGKWSASWSTCCSTPEMLSSVVPTKETETQGPVICSWRRARKNLYTAPDRPPSRLFNAYCANSPKQNSCTQYGQCCSKVKSQVDTARSNYTKHTRLSSAPWCGSTEHFPSTSRTNVEPRDLCQLHITSN